MAVVINMVYLFERNINTLGELTNANWIGEFLFFTLLEVAHEENGKTKDKERWENPILWWKTAIQPKHR